MNEITKPDFLVWAEKSIQEWSERGHQWSLAQMIAGHLETAYQQGKSRGEIEEKEIQRAEAPWWEL